MLIWIEAAVNELIENGCDNIPQASVGLFCHLESRPMTYIVLGVLHWMETMDV